MTRQPYQDQATDLLREAGQTSGYAGDVKSPPASGAENTGQQSWNASKPSESTGTGGQSGESMKDKAGEMTGQAQEKAGEIADQAQEKAGAVAVQAQEKADQGIQKTADGLERAAETLRSKAEGQDGPVGSVATTAVGAMEQGAGYLRGTDSDQLLTDLEAIVRQRPIESLLVAAGVGFVVSKALR